MMGEKRREVEYRRGERKGKEWRKTERNFMNKELKKRGKKGREKRCKNRK